jgi:hypothetical protein
MAPTSNGSRGPTHTVEPSEGLDSKCDQICRQEARNLGNAVSSAGAHAARGHDLDDIDAQRGSFDKRA